MKFPQLRCYPIVLVLLLLTCSALNARNLSPTNLLDYNTHISFFSSDNVEIFDINVSYIVNPGSLDSSQNRPICYNTSPPKISNGLNGSDASTDNGNIIYQWQSSVDSKSWIDIENEDRSSYSPPDLIASIYYRRQAYNDLAGIDSAESTNSILISVKDKIEAGFLLGDQSICENELPHTLSLSGTTSATGNNYHWQVSTDNINFVTLSNRQPTLSFTSTTTAWNPSVTSYYKVTVSNSNSNNCDDESTVAKIKVHPKPEIIQLSGPGPIQEICPGIDIISATFSLTGSATTLTVQGNQGSGLFFSGPNDVIYTLNGTPNKDVTITITANGISPCYDTAYNYVVKIHPNEIFELYVAFDFSIYRRNNRGSHKRLATDNY